MKFFHHSWPLGVLWLTLVLFTPGAVAPAVGDFVLRSPPPSPPPPSPASKPAPPPALLPATPMASDDIDTLGVHVVKPMYAVIPLTQSGKKNVTVSMTIWIRRVGLKGRYDMQHQQRDALRLMVWVDNPMDLHRRQWGHLKMPTNQKEWAPKLRIETAEPGPVLNAVVESGPAQLAAVREHELRPYSFRVELPPGSGDCFKILELSYPKHKAPICIPAPSSDRICSTLAPTDKFTSGKPALYTTIGPIRHAGSTRDWKRLHVQIAARLLNYVPYHTLMGVSGLLLYTDVITREYLRRDPGVMDLIKAGNLRLIKWDMPERAHDDTDGQGRPLGYNYDQALFASHALLGLSGCGTNLMLIVGDIDEYLYFPKPGMKWPMSLGSCMATRTRPEGNKQGRAITVHQLQRFEVLSTRVPPVDEWRLWTTPGTLGRNVSMTSGNATIAKNVVSHPLANYDLAFRRPLAGMHSKPVAMPAANVVLYFVHEGVPVYGQVQLVHSSCMVLLHVPNFFRGRRIRAYEKRDTTTLRKFQHWLFV